jgi:hypothetical protein
VVLLRENKKALLFTTYFPHPLLLILLATPCESRSLFWNRLHYQGVLVSKETYYIYLVSKETCYIYLVSKETYPAGACFGIGCTTKASLKGSAENPDKSPLLSSPPSPPPPRTPLPILHMHLLS